MLKRSGKSFGTKIKLSNQIYIKLKKNSETITIVSNFGKYNTINFDTIFSKNVKTTYLDNKITGDYMDFSMIKNLLIISKNVVFNVF